MTQQLIDHTNHILRNRFREQLGLPSGPPSADADDGWRVTATVITPSLLTVDRLPRDAVHVDTDPFVNGIGVQLCPHVTCTVVIPRDHLSCVDLAVDALQGR